MASQEELKKLRMQYKQTFKKAFDEFIESAIFQKFVKMLRLQKYTFCIAQPQHKPELLELICHQSSRAAESPPLHTLIFDLGPGDVRKEFKQKLDHLMNDGRMIVILDENNKVASCCSIADSYDKFHPTETTVSDEPLPRNHQHFMEMCMHFLNKYPIFDTGVEYGQECFFGMGATRKDAAKKGLHFIAVLVLYYVAYKCGYSYINSITDSASQRRKLIKFRQFWEFDCEMSYGEFKFSDGLDMEFYYQNLRDKYDWNEKQIDELRQKLRVVGCRSKIIAPEFDKSMNLFLGATKSKL